jgi:capsular exopolysaccharide synthesis family protein
VSRLFDAMRRAEAQRREQASRQAVPEETRRVETPAGPAVGTEQPIGMSGDLLRELGMLRNAVEVAFEGRKRKSLLFTSAMEGEGTTTIATNFARILALEGRERILLCEMNARGPSFSDVFSANGDAGVTDYFLADNSLQSLVRRSGQDGLDLLCAGRQDATVIQLNLKHAFPRLLEEALQTYDTVVIDAPPVILFPETPPMTGFVDGVVVVVHAGKTKRELVQRAIQSIVSFGGTVLGVVLNRKRYHIPAFLYRRI